MNRTELWEWRIKIIHSFSRIFTVWSKNGTSSTDASHSSKKSVLCPFKCPLKWRKHWKYQWINIWNAVLLSELMGLNCSEISTHEKTIYELKKVQNVLYILWKAFLKLRNNRFYKNFYYNYRIILIFFSFIVRD